MGYFRQLWRRRTRRDNVHFNCFLGLCTHERGAVISSGERHGVNGDAAARGREVVGGVWVHVEGDVLPVVGSGVEGPEDVVQGGERWPVAWEGRTALEHYPVTNKEKGRRV